MGIVEKIPRALNALFFTPAVYGAVASLAIIIAAWDHADRTKDKLHMKFENKQDTFDFIVVGSGSAGAVVAYRLSEHYSVLLLEAGGEPHPLQAIPGFALFLPNYPEIDWMHRTIPQKRSCFACPNGQSSWSAGKNLGGTGNLNFLITLRGSPRDYDNWAKITGDPSWSYEGVLPYFRKYEDFFGNTTDSRAHGVKGPVRIEVPDYKSIADEYIWAANELGYPHVDLNGDFKEGFDNVYYPIKKGVRQGPYRSYIQPARKRKTLTIRKFAHVNRVLIRGKYNEAYGVEYDRHGKTYTAYAKKEIVLSAGAIQSPKLLMLSGIGPWQHLKDMGIPIKANLPVGQNLQDHAATYLGPFLIDKPRTLFVDRDITAKAFLDWTIGKGPLTSSTVVASGLTISSLAKERGEWDWPDIQQILVALSIHKTFPRDTAHAFGFKESILTKYYAHAINKDAFTIIVSAGRPVARGDILLGGKNPYDALLIDPKYIEDPWDIDIKVMIESIHLALKMVEETRAMALLNARFTTQVFPGCEKFKFRSDEYWECYIRQYTVSLHHSCGTAAMGPVGSPNAVVDPELRVQGVKNLRVIDASIIPAIVVGNTQAPTIMIGEKGADMILEYWKNPKPHYDGTKHSEGITTAGAIHHHHDTVIEKLTVTHHVQQDISATPLHDILTPADLNQPNPHLSLYESSAYSDLNPAQVSPFLTTQSTSQLETLLHIPNSFPRVKRGVLSRASLRNVSIDSFPVPGAKKGKEIPTAAYTPEAISSSTSSKQKIPFSQLIVTNSTFSNDTQKISSRFVYRV